MKTNYFEEINVYICLTMFAFKIFENRIKLIELNLSIQYCMEAKTG